MEKMKNKEIVIVAMIGAVLGAFFMLLDTLYTPLSTLLGPIFINLTFGIYALSAILPMVIIKKPGAALIGSLVASVINILAGSPYGIHIIVAGLLQGLGCEVGFFVSKYKLNLTSLLISGVFITVFVTIRDYFIFGYNMLPPVTLIAVIAIRVISATFIGGYISKLIEAGLQKTGVLQK